MRPPAGGGSGLTGAAPGGRRVRTLVVDDDEVVAGLHQVFVAAHPAFEVVGAAHTGADAVAAVEALRPDLVLLDIHLPDVTGLEVLRQLRQRPGPPLDVFAITAAREVETVREALAGGVVHYLVKPFTAADLHERLTSYLARRAVLRGDAAPGASGGRLDQQQVDRALRPAPGPPAAGSAPQDGEGPRRAAAPTRPAAAPAPLEALAAGVVPPPPKGLSAVTLALVTQALRSAGHEVTASELADRVGLSRVSARRYLEHLTRTGVAVVAPRYGGVGRPEHLYAAVQQLRR